MHDVMQSNMESKGQGQPKEIERKLEDSQPHGLRYAEVATRKPIILKFEVQVSADKRHPVALHDFPRPSEVLCGPFGIFKCHVLIRQLDQVSICSKTKPVQALLRKSIRMSL